MDIIIKKSKKDKVIFKVDKLNISQSVVVGERIMDYNMVEKFPLGKPILLITGNMPEILQNKIDELINSFCNRY